MKSISIFSYRVLGAIVIGVWCLSSFGVVAQPTDIINKRSTGKIYNYLKVSDSDVQRYQKIFRALKNNEIGEANSQIKKLDSDVLLGHVLAEKYLNTDHKTNLSELKTWLSKYSDHPQAAALYRMALRKGGGSDVVCPYDPNYRPKGSYSWLNTDLRALKPADKLFVRKQVELFRKSINSGKTKAARNVLENARFKKLVPNVDLDAMAATLATKYLLDNNDALAFQWASKASKRTQEVTASWIAGLSSWRMGQYKTASQYFTRLAQSGNNDEWLVAAGAYWSYRSYSKLGNDAEANKWLKNASHYKRTFYGILANYKLGRSLSYNWEALSYLNDFRQDDYIDEIIASPSLQRSLILLHAKQPELAEKDLRHDYDNMSDKQKEVALFIANQYKMHALGVTISNRLKDEKRNIAYDAIAYPLPSYKPQNGWKVSKALLLALTRQESAFSPQAKSSAGACGLMQLLPSTAVHITQDRSLKTDTNQLLQADFNMELGQRYVTYLMEKPFVNGNLFYLMTAYNGGPGNLLKWQKSADYRNDPLLFIEVIPSRETRIYIERVMANMWIYQSRFDQNLSGIDALCEGNWPRHEKP